MKKLFIGILSTFLILSMTACNIDAAPSTDQKQAAQTEKMVAEAERRVGPVNITNFTEKRFAKLIMELRDSEVTTYSYFMDMSGGLHFLCDSIGYGISASIQLVNPDKVVRGKWREQGMAVKSQPEPNGLFMPEGLAATYILCSDGEGGVKPVYSEPELIVSPFKLRTSSSLAL